VQESESRRKEAEKSRVERCHGSYQGLKPTSEQFQEVLLQHLVWLATKGEQGGQANLCLADLDGITLKDAIPVGADLSGTKLRNANLRGAYIASATFHGRSLVV